MFNQTTILGRLTIAYAATVTLALVLFAIVSLITLNAVQHRLIDSQLSSIAQAEASAVDLSANGTLDAPDTVRFASTVPARMLGAVISSGGRVLVASTSNIPPDITGKAVTAADARVMTIDRPGDRIRAAFAPIMNGSVQVATVAVWTDAEVIGTVDRSLVLIFAAVLPLFAIIGALTARAITRRSLAPLEQIIADASEIEAHNLNTLVTLPDTNELSRLATTLNRMLARLHDAFERERRFSNDASHELRAPLSVILAEADLALTNERAPAEYRRTLETIAIEAQTLESLTRSLLSTARAGENRNPDLWELVDLSEIAVAVTERLRILAHNRSVRFSLTLSHGAFVSANPDDLEQGVLTIVHNAIKYAKVHGEVSITVASTRDARELRVADDGPGFSNDALEHAFDRFWRASNGGASLGHGLGLAIARSIADHYGGSIKVANGEHGGGLVTFRLPAQ